MTTRWTATDSALQYKLVVVRCALQELLFEGVPAAEIIEGILTLSGVESEAIEAVRELLS